MAVLKSLYLARAQKAHGSGRRHCAWRTGCGSGFFSANLAGVAPPSRKPIWPSTSGRVEGSQCRLPQVIAEALPRSLKAGECRHPLASLRRAGRHPLRCSTPHGPTWTPQPNTPSIGLRSWVGSLWGPASRHELVTSVPSRGAPESSRWATYRPGPRRPRPRRSPKAPVANLRRVGQAGHGWEEGTAGPLMRGGRAVGGNQAAAQNGLLGMRCWVRLGFREGWLWMSSREAARAHRTFRR